MNEPASAYPSAGDIIEGKYRIERVLGEGGMGAVMSAFHTMLKAPVALKFISPDVLRVPGAVERFLNEGVAARGIQSDHVVRIDDVGTLPSGLPYIVMEMLQGCDLSQLLEREGGGGLPTPRAIHFMLQILRGLHAAHAKGIVHRDLKPSNAFVIHRDGEPDFVKLLDFGISKLSQEPGQQAQQLTQTNTGLGTPLYMSPEQARNARDANPRSDLYSVSAILYELLTGRTPYLAETPNDLLYKLFTAEPDPILSLRPDLPPALASIIHQGLSKDPANRPASALEYAELLVPFADERSTDVVARIRANATNVSASSVLAAEGRSSLLSPAPAQRTEINGEKGYTLVSAQTHSATQLDMNVTPSPPATGAVSPSAKVLLAIGVAAIVAGSAVLLMRPTSTPLPAAPTSEPRATATEPPPPASSLPQVVVLPASAEPTASVPSASTPVTSASARPGPTRPVSTKKNPFGVGIMQ